MEMFVSSYGKSMYGGWYVNLFINGTYTGERAKTLKELKNKVILKYGYLEFNNRVDD